MKNRAADVHLEDPDAISHMLSILRRGYVGINEWMSEIHLHKAQKSHITSVCLGTVHASLPHFHATSLTSVVQLISNSQLQPLANTLTNTIQPW